ncbi:uncharacterized protein LOC134833097 [Culicoides brevitarsis]|uniref:uncharacterized protein LOC134833097 n=1 Tax=Culicoides brevitarsis TaxID=469753 RepID=UPI00307BF859
MDLYRFLLTFFAFFVWIFDFTSSTCTSPTEEVRTLQTNLGLPYIHKTYTWGRRYTGDHQLWETKKSMLSNQFTTLHIDFVYPQQEFYTTITQVVVEAAQSSSSGVATCLEGGIRQDFVTIAVDANYATFLNATFSVFGHVF